VPILVVQHLSIRRSQLPEILEWACGRPAKWAEQGEETLPDTIYVAPVDHHLRIGDDGRLSVTVDAKIGWFRPCADALFESMARVYGSRAVSVVLSGMMHDGARGTAAVGQCGGLTMAQDKATSEFFDMPAAAIDYGRAEIVMAPRRLALALGSIAA